MLLYPLAAAVLILLDGKPVPAYANAFESKGRVFAPVSPYLTRIADRLWYEGDTLVIERNGRTAHVLLPSRAPDALETVYVAVAPVLRSLGISVTYDAQLHRLDVEEPSDVEIVTPAPFDASAPEASPRPVFTPTAPPTARPAWNGLPVPRRTPLPYPP